MIMFIAYVAYAFEVFCCVSSCYGVPPSAGTRTSKHGQAADSLPRQCEPTICLTLFP